MYVHADGLRGMRDLVRRELRRRGFGFLVVRGLRPFRGLTWVRKSMSDSDIAARTLTRPPAAFGGGAGSGRFLLRLFCGLVLFSAAGGSGGPNEPGIPGPVVGWGKIPTSPAGCAGGAASGRKSLNSAIRSGASLNNIWTCA